MLELRKLRFRYPDGGKPFCFDGPPCGPYVELKGVSGGGKSTLLMLLAGHLKAGSGAASWRGIDLTASDLYGRPCAVQFQDAKAFPETSVRRNIALGVAGSLRLDRAGWRRVDEAMAMLGLTDLGSVRAADLSGGELRRLTLARTCLKVARFEGGLLMLDEPMAGLDAESQVRCMEYLDTVVAGDPDLGLIIASHQALPEGPGRRRKNAGRRGGSAVKDENRRPRFRSLTVGTVNGVIGIVDEAA